MHITETPAYPGLESCPEQLSPGQVAQFQRDGFVGFSNVLTRDEVEKACAALTESLGMLQAGKRIMRNGYGTVWGHPENKFKVQFQAGHEPAEDDDVSGQADRVRKYHEFVGVEPFLTSLALEHTRLQGVLSSILGPNPILTQDMALTNPPKIGTGKPWHQDDAYFNISPLGAVCGVWIALDAASAQNGCMNFLPGWHRRGPLRHYHGSDCEIVPERLQDLEIRPVPLPPGGAVFFSGVAPHMTRPNSSTLRRRALQLHYRSAYSQLLPAPEYDRVFVEADGTPASCAAASRRGF